MDLRVPFLCMVTKFPLKHEFLPSQLVVSMGPTNAQCAVDISAVPCFQTESSHGGLVLALLRTGIAIYVGLALSLLHPASLSICPGTWVGGILTPDMRLVLEAPSPCGTRVLPMGTVSLAASSQETSQCPE